ERHRWNQLGQLTYFGFASVLPRTRPFRDAIDPARRAIETAKEHGDLAFASAVCRSLIFILLAVGHPLDEVQQEIERTLELGRRVGPHLESTIVSHLALVRTLRGKTTKFGCLDDELFTEHAFEQNLTGQPYQAHSECYYWLRKLQARFLAGDYMSATEAADRL